MGPLSFSRSREYGQGSWMKPLKALGQLSSSLGALWTPASIPQSKAAGKVNILGCHGSSLTSDPPVQVSRETLLLYEAWRLHTAFYGPANCDQHKVYAKREH